MPSPTHRPPVDAILRKVLEAVPFTLSADEGIEVARRRFRELPRRPVHLDVEAVDRTIEGSGGPLPVRVYRPPTAPDVGAPVVVFFHGGGFVVGDLDTHDGSAREHAAATGAVVVSVGYRLAPEHRFPAAAHDAWDATRWVADHADELGTDSARLAVAGDSAGGNLAAVVAQRARDAALPIAYQLLWYPVTDTDRTLPSFAENADAPILTTAAVRQFSLLYAGERDVTDPPAALAPARAADLTGLPPTWVAVAGHDPLRDDGIRYAELLRAAGVAVTLDHAATLVHGYLGYAGVVPAATEAVGRALAGLRAALHR